MSLKPRFAPGLLTGTHTYGAPTNSDQGCGTQLQREEYKSNPTEHVRSTQQINQGSQRDTSIPTLMATISLLSPTILHYGTGRAGLSVPIWGTQNAWVVLFTLLLTLPQTSPGPLTRKSLSQCAPPPPTSTCLLGEPCHSPLQSPPHTREAWAAGRLHSPAYPPGSLGDQVGLCTVLPMCIPPTLTASPVM